MPVESIDLWNYLVDTDFVMTLLPMRNIIGETFLNEKTQSIKSTGINIEKYRNHLDKSY